MIEVVVAPAAAGLRVPLGILDGHVGAVELTGEVAAARRFRTRTVGKVLGAEDSLQLLEEDRAFRKVARLLVDLVGSRLDVDIVVFGEAGLAIVQGVGRQRRSNVYPGAPVLGQDQIAFLGVLGQVASAGRGSIGPLARGTDQGRNRRKSES